MEKPEYFNKPQRRDDSIQEANQKQVWDTPRLRDLGDVIAETKFGLNSGSDGGLSS
jgi:hypothetical protein